MLIINADDLGGTEEATDNIIACFRQGRITSASALVFMMDSRRAAISTAGAGLETGLHLNLDMMFDAPEISAQLRRHQAAVVGYLRHGKWAQVVYNPFLKKDFDYVFKAQYDEYCRLYGKEPAQIDGHHHMHLCMNIMVDRVIPPGSRIRRNFSVEPERKGIINRSYRRMLDALLARRYRCVDWFYSLEPANNFRRLERIMHLAARSNVELMVHPARIEQCEFLMSSYFRDLIARVPKGSYRALLTSF